MHGKDDGDLERQPVCKMLVNFIECLYNNSMTVKQVRPENSGMILVVSFFVLWAINSLVIWIANLWFPEWVVLGTAHITYGWAFFHAVGSLALINTFAVPFVHEYEKRKNYILTSRDWMVVYLGVNFVGLWILARFAEQLGMGLSSWVVALVLAAVLDAMQGLGMMQLEKFRKK